MNINPNRGGRRKEQQMNAVAKATALAVLIAVGKWAAKVANRSSFCA